MRFRQYDVTDKKTAVVEVFMICFLSYELFGSVFDARSFAGENWIFVVGIIIFGYSFFSPKAYITVDEKGISCEHKGKIKWEFTWDEISHMERKPSLAGRTPSDAPLRIVLTDDAARMHRELLVTVSPVFQYGEKAREALSMYCRCEIILIPSYK